MEWGNKLNTKKKILVVDDKGMNRYMLGGIFRDNYEIIEAGGGMEAIAIIDKEMMNWREFCWISLCRG